MKDHKERTMRPTHLAFVAASVLPAAAVLAQTYRYALIPINPPDDSPHAAISDVNESGDIAGGWFVDAPGEGSRAFRWHEGTSVDLGILVGEYVSSGRMNSYGDIVGYCKGHDQNLDFFDRATIWTRKGEALPLDSELGYDPKTHAKAINDAGLVAGLTYTPGSGIYGSACTWMDGVRTPLQDLGPGLESAAFAVNNHNEIVGFAGDPNGIRNAAYWKDGILTVLPGLGGRYTVAWAVNENGVIAGSAEDGAGRTRAVLWRNSQIEIVDEGIPPRAIVNVYDMNDFEEIVGDIAPERGPSQAVIRSNGVWALLDDMLPPKTDFEISGAVGINNLGMVAVVGRGALLMPVNPTLSLSDPVPGIAGRTNTLTLTGAPPNSRVFFYYGFHGGGEVIPGCPVADLVALQLTNPHILDSVVADETGTAVVSRFVSGAARRADLVLFQCAIPSECRISQLVAFKFQ